MLSVTHKDAGQELDQRFLNPGFAVGEEQEQQQQVQGSHDDERQWRARISAEPIGKAKRQEHHDGNEQQEEDKRQGGSRQQSHHLIDDVQLDILLLQSEVVLQHFYELRNGLNVLIA